MSRMPRRLAQVPLVVAATRAVEMLPEHRRRRLLLLVVVQLFLGALDLVAVTLVGLLGSLSVSGIQSKAPAGLIARVLGAVGLASQTLQMQVSIIAIVVVFLLLGRTFASIWLTRKALHFLALRTAEASGAIAERLLAQPITYVQSKGTQELIYIATSGPGSAVLGVLGTLVMMAADAAMLVVLSILLLVVSPIVAVVLGLVMAGIVALLHRFSTSKAGELGERHAAIEVLSRNVFAESVATYRDAVVRGSRPRYARVFREARTEGAFINAELTFLPNVSKYVLESAVVVAALVVGAIQFSLTDAQAAVAVIAVFLAAGTRLSPAIIRLQQGVFQLRMHVGQSDRLFALLEDLPASAAGHQVEARFNAVHDGFTGSVAVRDLEFAYPGAKQSAVAGWNLELAPGQMVALVGPSGAGKSTAADLLLGVLKPQKGTVTIAGAPVEEAIERWPGAVAFVPQDVWIADGTVRHNVSLGFADGEVPDEAIWAALEKAHLASHVRSLPDQLDAQVGERGTQLSGGQRQRLGIARALLTRPKLLVLDEATSALDAATEHDVTEAIRGLQGEVTLVVIAHRLTTVRHADLVQYMETSEVLAEGDFEAVARSVPAFKANTQLLGLS